MKDCPKIKIFTRKIKIEEVPISYNILNNGTKCQIPVLVEYVENFSIETTEDYDNIIIRKCEKFLNLIKFIFVQGLIDVNAKSKNKYRTKGRESAKKFFKKNNENFNLYCRLIDVNPNYMLKLYNVINTLPIKRTSLIETLEMIIGKYNRRNIS